MKDPFVILRDELVEAAERVAPPAPRKRWGWLRRPSRPVAVLLVALVITGSAAAAILSLSASQPLVGRVPGASSSASLAGFGYTIRVTPVLWAGGGDGGRGSSTAGRAPAAMSSRKSGRWGIHRPRAPCSAAVAPSVAASPATHAAPPSSMSSPAHRCSPSGLGAGRSAPSPHAPCRRLFGPPCSSSTREDRCQ